MTSTMAKMITGKQRGRHIRRAPTDLIGGLRERVLLRTEGQPGLPNLQVHGKVSLQAQVTDGDVRTGLALQAGKLQVTVENTYGKSVRKKK